MMKDKLRRILGMTPEPPALPTYTEHEMIARRTLRNLTIVGYEAYDIWCIAEQILQYSLAPLDHPDLFPPNQRNYRKHYPSV